MRQFLRILCPVDFSDESRHALEHAAQFARWYDAGNSRGGGGHVSVPFDRST